jgi:tetratricopeptide (TPR) repeat protein
MSSADKSAPPPETTEAAAELNPLVGGRWRLVRPEELSRKRLAPRASGGASQQVKKAPKPKLRLERRQELEHHLKESPTDLEAFLELGRLYRSENRPVDARRILQQAIQIFPDEKELIWEYEEAVLARSLQQLREVTELAQKLNTAETDRELKRSQNDWACRRMDVCLARLSRDPSLLHLRLALGEAMYDAGMYEAAIEELDRALDSDELSPAAFLVRGRCLLAMGRDVEAMASLRASALRRSVVAPARTRVIALRLLCETAERLGVGLTLTHYRQHLQQAEQELTQQSAP